MFNNPVTIIAAVAAAETKAAVTGFTPLPASVTRPAAKILNNTSERTAVSGALRKQTAGVIRRRSRTSTDFESAFCDVSSGRKRAAPYPKLIDVWNVKAIMIIPVGWTRRAIGIWVDRCPAIRNWFEQA